MTTFRTNILTLYYKGATYIIRYWADGHGRRVPDYTTSVVQLRTLLHKRLSTGPLDFYCILDKKKRLVTNDRHMIQALEDVPDGGSLAMYACEYKDLDLSKLFSNKKKNRKDEPKKKNKKDKLKKEEESNQVIKKKNVTKKNTTKKKKVNKKTRRRTRSPPQQIQLVNPRLGKVLPVH